MKIDKVYRFIQSEKDAGFKRDSVFLLHLCVSFKCVQNIPKNPEQGQFFQEH